MAMGKSYYLDTYGCQMNMADSELIAGMLKKQGYVISKSMDNADAIFVNTCAIRERAEEKVHSRLGVYSQIKKNRPGVIIGVLGCMAQHLKDKILESKPYVDIVLGPDSYRKLPVLLDRNTENTNNTVDTKLSRFEVYDNLFPSRQDGINAWVSIMRGCDKFCTFCVVPFTRGRERSRSITSIVTEVHKAIAAGHVEITLLGQNVNSFQYDDQKFQHLLQAVAEIPGVQRLRYTSPHPQDMTEDLLDTMVTHENICNYVHLPLQSGSDRILKRMNRTYSRDHFIQLAHRIREILPGVGISTDIIVGFPGETDAEFRRTLWLMERVGFDNSYMFAYSPRPGTPAAELGNDVPEPEKRKRLQETIELQKEITLRNGRQYVGQKVKVLIEEMTTRNGVDFKGRSPHYWMVHGKEGKKPVYPGEQVEVQVEDTKGHVLLGACVN